MGLGEFINRNINSIKFKDELKELYALYDDVFSFHSDVANYFADPGKGLPFLESEIDALASGQNPAQDYIRPIKAILSPDMAFEDRLLAFSYKLNAELELLINTFETGSSTKDIELFTDSAYRPDEAIDSVMLYHNLWEHVAEHLENSALEAVASPFQHMVLDHVVTRNSLFLNKSKKHNEVGESLYDEFNDWSAGMKKIFDFDVEETINRYVDIMDRMNKKVNSNQNKKRPLPSLFSFKPLKRARKKSQDVSEEALNPLMRKISQTGDWSNLAEVMVDYLKDSSHKLFSNHMAFMNIGGVNQTKYELLSNTELIGVNGLPLYGVDEEKNILMNNLESMIRGKPAANMIIEGSSGSGKSTLLFKSVDKFFDKGLKYIHTDLAGFYYSNQMLQGLKKDSFFYVLGVDNVNLEDKEIFSSDLITPITNCLPDNVVIAFISKKKWRSSGSLNKSNQDSIYDFGTGIVLSLPEPSQENQIRHLYDLAIKRSEQYASLNGELDKAYKDFISLSKIKSPNYKTVQEFSRILPPDPKDFKKQMLYMKKHE